MGASLGAFAAPLFLWTAVADLGDVAIGARLGGAWPPQARLAVGAELGVNDWFSLAADAGPAIGSSGFEGLAAFHLVAALDVFTWVPELRAGGGVRLGGSGVAPRLVAGLGLRHYLSLAWWLELRLLGEWSPANPGALVQVGFSRLLL